MKRHFRTESVLLEWNDIAPYLNYLPPHARVVTCQITETAEKTDSRFMVRLVLEYADE